MSLDLNCAENLSVKNFNIIKPPSLVKWSGSKRTQASLIKSIAPNDIKRYFEPFLGGGSVLYFFSDYKCYASDIYAPLIEFWNKVKNNPEEVIEHYTRNWLQLQKNLPGHFYVVRERFNNNPNGLDLLFLTRTCVNGIVRFNNAGEFNNSFHLSRKGMTPDKFESIVKSWNAKLSKVNLSQGSYLETLKNCKNGDFVYLDPPYEGSKQRYISSIDFNLLWQTLEKLSSKGVKWALSFDGSRGDQMYEATIPKDLYLKKHEIDCGLSTLSQVLNSKSETVIESLYCNY